jgi:hypothetical protein
MGYSLKQALLLSSLSQAALDIQVRGYAIDYRLVVTHQQYPDENKELLALRVYRVFDKKTSYHTSNIAEKPHKLIQKDTIGEMIEYLREHCFVVDDAWTPLEPEEDSKT